MFVKTIAATMTALTLVSATGVAAGAPCAATGYDTRTFAGVEHIVIDVRDVWMADQLTGPVTPDDPDGSAWIVGVRTFIPMDGGAFTCPAAAELPRYAEASEVRAREPEQMLQFPDPQAGS